MFGNKNKLGEVWASTSAEGGKPGKGRRPKFWQKKTARERSAAPSKCARGGLCNDIAWMHGIRHVRRKGRGASAGSTLLGRGGFKNSTGGLLG